MRLSGTYKTLVSKISGKRKHRIQMGDECIVHIREKDVWMWTGFNRL